MNEHWGNVDEPEALRAYLESEVRITKNMHKTMNKSVWFRLGRLRGTRPTNPGNLTAR